ncbi:MAG: hypothetical protein PHI12_08260 [Dehalococcoidales bacterium]|nr:hypothetical protein [Dehalococcoidales bacterium]
MSYHVINPHAKGGFRKDIGIYVRSLWEANYCRYLNWVIAQGGDIVKWEYEVQTFEFPVKRGTRFYCPDFKLWIQTGLNQAPAVEFVEIKGYMDPKSATKLKRMAKYYPDVKITVIGEEWFQAVKRQGVDALIPGWEYNFKEEQ